MIRVKLGHIADDEIAAEIKSVQSDIAAFELRCGGETQQFFDLTAWLDHWLDCLWDEVGKRTGNGYWRDVLPGELRMS